MSLILPTSEQQSHIRAILKEDVATREQDLKAIKEWLKKQPHLPDTWDDRRLLNFLRGCKFSMEKCKRKLDMYFTMRAMIPEFFKNRDVNRPEIQKLLEYGFIINLPVLTPDGKRVHLIGATTNDFETPDLAIVAKLIFMVRDVRLEKEEFGTLGDVYVIDASIAIPKHIFKMSPATLKKLIICILEAYPTMLKEIHFVNLTPFLDTLLNIVKPFLKEKIKKRIQFHSSLESLHKCVPKEILPEEYGGTAGKLNDFREQMVKTLREYTSWFKEQEKVEADESKRPDKSYSYEELFGLDGSFRKLDVD